MITITNERHDTPRTLRDYFDNVYVPLKLRAASDSTKRHYYYSLRYFERHLRRPAVLSDLTDDTVGAVMSFIVAKDGLRLGPRSANKFRDNILALWRFLERKGHIEHGPDVDPLPEPKRIPVAWSPDELARLWRACDSQFGTIGDVPANLWWHGLHAVAWDTGERITAIANLLVSDIDFDRGWITVRAELRKGKRADKISRMHDDTAAALRKIISTSRGRLFPWPYVPTYLWNRYDRLLMLAGLPHDRYHKFHCLRKSVASYFKAAGGDATSLLGHASVAITAKYLDPRITGEQHAADVLFRPVAGDEPTDATIVEPVAIAPVEKPEPDRDRYRIPPLNDSNHELEASIDLFASLDEFQDSNCWHGANADHRRKRAVYRLRAIFSACSMTTAADLDAGLIENYLRSLLAAKGAAKTVCEYAQDVSMFVRWLAATKMPSGVRPGLAMIVAISARRLVDDQILGQPCVGTTPPVQIKLRGSGPPKRRPQDSYETGPFMTRLWSPGGYQ